MSTAYLLSTHSSNPLEASPSDRRNRAFVRRYQSTKAQSDVEPDSSEDEKFRDTPGTVQAYRTHIAGMYPEMQGQLRVKGLTGKVNETQDLAPCASTSQGGMVRKVDLKGKGKALDVPNGKQTREPMFVDLDEDMSDEGVPGVGECKVLVDEDEDADAEAEDDEQNGGSQDPVGSGGEDDGSDIDMPVDGDGENDAEDDVDLDSKHIPDLDDATSSSSAHLPSSSLSHLLKSKDEQLDIQIEIADLNDMVPSLATDYHLVDRLGSGTFSSVYKAVDLNHDKYDNNVWQLPTKSPHNIAPYYVRPDGSGKVYIGVDPTKRRDTGKVYVAVKRIYVTSGPERVRNELSIMEDCRGCRHTSQLITAFRHRDQVVAIMPYCRNEDFRVRPPVLHLQICIPVRCLTC